MKVIKINKLQYQNIIYNKDITQRNFGAGKEAFARWWGK